MQTKNAGVQLAPTSRAMIGTTARIGIACSATRYGHSDRSSHLACDISDRQRHAEHDR